MAMTVQEQLAALQAENERLKAAQKAKVKPLSLKVGDRFRSWSALSRLTW